LFQRIPIPTPQSKGKPPAPQNLRLLAGAPTVLACTGAASRCRGSRTPAEVDRSRKLQEKRRGSGSTVWRWRRREWEAAARRGAGEGGERRRWRHGRVLGARFGPTEGGDRATQGKGRAYQVLHVAGVARPAAAAAAARKASVRRGGGEEGLEEICPGHRPAQPI